MTKPLGVRVTAPLLFICACSARAPEPSAGLAVQPGLHTLSVSTSAPVTAAPGYVHSLGNSRFLIGQSALLEFNGANLQRWRGSLGAFALDPTNGWAIAISNANSPQVPYMLDDGAQGSKVAAYFVAAGIPASQIGPAKSTYGIAGGGSMSELMSQPIQLHSVTSTLTRIINGITVVDSYAAARMTTAEAVDWEAVFWPPIDMAVVNNAVALASKLSDPVAHARYLATLPGTATHDSGVVIRHTSPDIHAPPIAYVSYDVTVDPDRSAIDRHFDQDGVEFRLPQEHLPGPRSDKHP